MNSTTITVLIALLCSHLSAFSQVFLPDWPSANSYVRAFAFDAIHGQLFVAGSFTTLGNQPRSRLAAIDIQTGTVTSFAPDVNDSVDALCVHDSVLYIGGMFSEVNAQPRTRLAAFNTNTLELLPWAPSVSSLPVRALAMDGGDLLVGGDLGTVDGESRPYLAKFDMPSGSLSSWDAQVVNGTVKSICVHEDAIFLAGGYLIIGGVPRSLVAKLDRATGALLPWNAYFIGGEANSIGILDTILWVGGDWGSIQGSPPGRIVPLSVSTAEIACTVDEPDGPIRSLFTSPDRIFIGGGFHMIGAEERMLAALLSVDDCSLNTTDPSVGNYSPAHVIMAVGMYGDLLVAGGYFNTEGSTHHNLAAWQIDGATVGITEREEEVPFRIWPNPCEHELHLETPTPDAVSVEIVSTLGGIVLAGPYEPKIDMSGLPVGVYAIQLRGRNGAILRTALVLREQP